MESYPAYMACAALPRWPTQTPHGMAGHPAPACAVQAHAQAQHFLHDAFAPAFFNSFFINTSFAAPPEPTMTALHMMGPIHVPMDDPRPLHSGRDGLAPVSAGDVDAPLALFEQSSFDLSQMALSGSAASATATDEDSGLSYSLCCEDVHETQLGPEVMLVYTPTLDMLDVAAMSGPDGTPTPTSPVCHPAEANMLAALGSTMSSHIQMPYPSTDVSPAASCGAQAISRLASARCPSAAHSDGDSDGEDDGSTASECGDNSVDIDGLERGGYFDMPIKDAARRLDMGVTTLKKICRKDGIERWPFRLRKSMRKTLQRAEVIFQDLDENQRTWLINKLARGFKGNQVSEAVKKVRQFIFKWEYRKRQGDKPFYTDALLKALMELA